ncbi:MAG TPA: hypothetical protein VIY86_14820, partial [Pirellulaceae bacterium]
MRWGFLASCFLVMGLIPLSRAWTQAPSPISHPDSQLPEAENRKLGLWLLEHLLQEALPEHYEDAKKWGTTKEVFDGWHIKADGLKISTHKKRKRVRHGTWKRYTIDMVDPATNLRLHLGPWERLDPVTTRCQVYFSTRADVRGELQEWQRDVKLLGVSATARADVELHADVRVRTT